MKQPQVPDFPSLIRWVADTFHDGAVLPISRKIGVSPAIVALWVNGVVKNPTITNLERLCEAYFLDFNVVRKTIRQG